LTEFLFIESPNALINAAESFTSQSLIAGWLLLSYVLLRIKGRKKLYLASALFVVLSAPATIQLYQSKAPDYYTVDRNDVEVVGFLGSTEPDSVVLHPANFRTPSLASNLAGRQSVYSGFFSFLGDWIGTPEQSRRLRDSINFFSSSETMDRASILDKYGVDYVYTTYRHVPVLEKEPDLMRVFSNNRYVVYKVRSGGL
jgi:hypothetical protein